MVEPVESIAVAKDEFFCADLDLLFLWKYGGTSNNVCVQQVFYVPLGFTIPLIGLHHHAHVQDCIK